MKKLTFAATLLAVSVTGALITNVLTANENNSNNQPNSTTTDPAVVATAAPLAAPVVPVLHCEVPCGIYADQMRFEMMLEDTATIAKAITGINDFAAGLEGVAPSAKDVNQVNRWVTTKENHATNTQHIVAQYFLTQRIKPDHKDYTGQLATAHQVMVAAMKCKQDADPATAEALKKAILDLYRAYEGKEPAFHEEASK